MQLTGEYIHYRNGNSYYPIDTCLIQVDDNWEPAVIYTDASSAKYCRSLAEFLSKFHPHVPLAQ